MHYNLIFIAGLFATNVLSIWEVSAGKHALIRPNLISDARDKFFSFSPPPPLTEGFLNVCALVYPCFCCRHFLSALSIVSMFVRIFLFTVFNMFGFSISLASSSSSSSSCLPFCLIDAIARSPA